MTDLFACTRHTVARIFWPARLAWSEEINA